MVEEKKSIENKSIFDILVDSYKATSKIWEDSYFKIYKPWLETAGELFEKAAKISKEPTPERYKEFYEEWLKTYQKDIEKFHGLMTKPNKGTLEKILSSSEESMKLYRSWINELEKNSKKIKDMLQEEPDAAKYRDTYDAWIRSYEKMFNEFLSSSMVATTSEMFESYTGMPDIYSRTFIQMSKIWKDSYSKLYRPWIESTSKISEKMVDISKGESPEKYKEFYNIWVEAYKDAYGDYTKSVQSSKDTFENFVKNTNIYLNLYKSWIVALEKMSEKTKEFSKQVDYPGAHEEFFNLWIKMNEKAFDTFFEDMPVVSPMKEMMEPVKIMTKTYADMFVKMSRMWVKFYFGFVPK